MAKASKVPIPRIGSREFLTLLKIETSRLNDIGRRVAEAKRSYGEEGTSLVLGSANLQTQSLVYEDHDQDTAWSGNEYTRSRVIFRDADKFSVDDLKNSTALSLIFTRMDSAGERRSYTDTSDILTVGTLPQPRFAFAVPFVLASFLNGPSTVDNKRIVNDFLDDAHCNSVSVKSATATLDLCAQVILLEGDTTTVRSIRKCVVVLGRVDVDNVAVCRQQLFNAINKAFYVARKRQNGHTLILVWPTDVFQMMYGDRVATGGLAHAFLECIALNLSWDVNKKVDLIVVLPTLNTPDDTKTAKVDHVGAVVKERVAVETDALANLAKVLGIRATCMAHAKNAKEQQIAANKEAEARLKTQQKEAAKRKAQQEAEVGLKPQQKEAEAKRKAQQEEAEARLKTQQEEAAKRKAQHEAARLKTQQEAEAKRKAQQEEAEARLKTQQEAEDVARREALAAKIREKWEKAGGRFTFTEPIQCTSPKFNSARLKIVDAD